MRSRTTVPSFWTGADCEASLTLCKLLLILIRDDLLKLRTGGADWRSPEAAMRFLRDRRAGSYRSILSGRHSNIDQDLPAVHY